MELADKQRGKVAASCAQGRRFDTWVIADNCC